MGLQVVEVMIEHLSVGHDGSLTIYDGPDNSASKIGYWKQSMTKTSVRSTGNNVYVHLWSGSAVSYENGLFLKWMAGETRNTILVET